ncbi:MAG: tetratricopeptide repeat protein [Anaerolineae bacterium]|nr:tetratricopeptide repeat protein [Anaerolineae bacterium]
MIHHFALITALLAAVVLGAFPLAAQDCTIMAGQAAFDAGQYAEAFDIFQCVDNTGEAEEQAVLGIGRAALMLDEYSVAANAAAWAAEAVGLSQSEYGPQQIERLTRARVKDPDSLPLMTELAYWLWLRARDDEAIPLYAAILEADPQNAFALTFGASSQAYLGDLDAADAGFAQALELAPENDHIYSIAASTYHDLGYPEVALGYSDQALELRPGEFAGRYVTRGEILMDLRNYEAAIEDFQQALDLNPENFDALTGLADSLLRIGEYDAGFNPVNQALTQNPDSLVARVIRGYLYLNTDEPELARADFERVIELDPEHADALGGLGDLAYNADDFEAAVRFYQQAVASDPSSRYVRAGLADTLATLNDAGAAQALADLFQLAGNPLELAAAGKPQVLPLDFDTVYVTTIEANAGDTISASATSVEDGLLDPALVILANDGEAVAFSDDADGFDAALDAFVVTKPGTYTVLIGLLDSVRGDARLTVRVTPAG